MTNSITGRNSTYFGALAFCKELGATRGIDAALKQHNLDALILPAQGPATIPACKTNFGASQYLSHSYDHIAASAGYPIVTGKH